MISPISHSYLGFKPRVTYHGICRGRSSSIGQPWGRRRMESRFRRSRHQQLTTRRLRQRFEQETIHSGTSSSSQAFHSHSSAHLTSERVKIGPSAAIEDTSSGEEIPDPEDNL